MMTFLLSRAVKSPLFKLFWKNIALKVKKKEFNAAQVW